MAALSRPKKFPRLFHFGNGSGRSPRCRRFWKHSTPHFVRKGFRGTHDDLKMSVLFHEQPHEFIKEARNIIANQHLAVALRTGSDADGWESSAGKSLLGDQIRNGVEQ